MSSTITPIQDSTSTGFLVPEGPPPLDADGLDSLFQSVLMGITGFAQTWVRPRWQTEPASNPDVTQDWASFGFADREAKDFVYFMQNGGADPDANGNPQGNSTMTRQGVLSLLISMRGPNYQANGEMLRDGFAVSQNVDSLRPYGIQLLKTNDRLVVIPELQGTRYTKRADLTVWFGRETKRIYPIRNIAGAQFGIASDAGTQNAGKV